jgi:hypothetical protein
MIVANINQHIKTASFACVNTDADIIAKGWWTKHFCVPSVVSAAEGFYFASTVLRLIDLSCTLFAVVSLVGLVVIQFTL